MLVARNKLRWCKRGIREIGAASDTMQWRHLAIAKTTTARVSTRRDR